MDSPIRGVRDKIQTLQFGVDMDSLLLATSLGFVLFALVLVGLLAIKKSLTSIQNTIPKAKETKHLIDSETLNRIEVLIGNVFSDHLILYEDPQDYSHISKMVDYSRGIVFAQISGKETILTHWNALRKFDVNTTAALLKITGDVMCVLALSNIDFKVVSQALAKSFTNIVSTNSVADDVLQARQVSEKEMTELLHDNGWLVVLYFISRSRGVYNFFKDYANAMVEKEVKNEKGTNKANDRA